LKAFSIGQKVRIKTESQGPNRRVPGYARGRTGIIVEAHGVVPDYQRDHRDDWGPLYSVHLDPTSVERSNVRVVLDVHESWLEEWQSPEKPEIESRSRPRL
jgi:hypothetical protein